MITCKEYVKEKKAELKYVITEVTKDSTPPVLTIITVGNDFASKKYVEGKLKDCAEVGIITKHISLSETIQNHEFNAILKAVQLKSDGIIVQLPIPEHLYIKGDSILECQDVDGLMENTYHNPCTPAGIISILEANKIELDGANVVIIGRGKLVGRPLFDMMLKKDATVTLCHSHTKNLKEHCLTADIIVSAVGSPKLVTADMVKDGAVVIDVGVSRDENGKVIGDCDYPNLVDKCKFITPWVGGVGLLTRVSLLENVIIAYNENPNRLCW